MRAALLLLALMALAPVASACEGLSPGDNVVSDGASCTLAFLVADPTGLYFMTAGHCIAEGASATNPDHGSFGVGAFTHLAGQAINGEGSPGDDFALIRIDPSFYSELNPKMCGWNGPTGIFSESATTGGVRHYGHGMVFGDVEETRPRMGVGLQYDGGDSFRWLGAGLPGDSGSAVIHEDGRALGVLTHFGAGAATTNSGTHITRGFALAAEAGYDLRLVLAGEDPRQVLSEVRGGVTPPDEGTDDAADDAEPDEAPQDDEAPSDEEPPADGEDDAPAANPPPADDTPLDQAAAAQAGDAKTPLGAPLLAVLLAGLIALARRR